jgi:hypothetical protein
MVETELYEVQEALAVTGRGCVLLPGLLEPPSVSLHSGDAVRLLRPDGESFDSTILYVETVHRRLSATPEIRWVVVLPPSVATNQIPAGTRLRLVGSGRGVDPS